MKAQKATTIWSWMMVALLIALTGCVEEPEAVEEAEIESSLTLSQKRERARLIKSAAAAEGLSNAVLLAGVANAETGMAHCWSEARWACKGPASSSCGGGPVIAGSGDGPCSRKQGGLGMFQFDAGTHNQTLNRYGNSVLTVEGNTSHAVDFVVDMVIRSRYISNVSTRQQALDWLNSVRVDGRNWTAWIQTVTHYYNGCVPGRCRVYNSRFNSYSTKGRSIFNDLGADFWNQGAPPPPVTNDLNAPGTLLPESGTVANGASIDLSWSQINGATSYEVAMEYASGNQWTSYHTWTGRRSATFTVWPQRNNTNYRWSVRSCDSGGCSPWSSHAFFGTGSAVPPQPEEPQPEPEPEPQPEPEEPQPEPEPQPQPEEPGAPSGLSPNGATFSSGSVGLTWRAMADIDAYDVNMMVLRNGSWQEYFTWTGRRSSSFTVWPQITNTHYRWRVRGCNGDGCSPWSQAATFGFGRPAPLDDNTPDEPQPEPQPEGIQPPGAMSPAGGTISRPSVELTWSEVNGATTYDVNLMVQRNGTWTEYHTWRGRTSERFTVWPQRDNSNYRWRVRACDRNTCSDYSPFETFFFNGL